MAEVKIAKFGTRQAVFEGQAEMTKGKLKREDIIFEGGRYKSIKAVERGKSLISQLRSQKIDVPEQVKEPEEVQPDLPKKETKKRTRATKPKDVSQV